MVGAPYEGSNDLANGRMNQFEYKGRSGAVCVPKAD